MDRKLKWWIFPSRIFICYCKLERKDRCKVTCKFLQQAVKNFLLHTGHKCRNLATVEASDMAAVEMFNNDIMMAWESLRTVEDVNVEGPLETTEPLILEAIGTSDNVLLQKLLVSTILNNCFIFTCTIAKTKNLLGLTLAPFALSYFQHGCRYFDPPDNHCVTCYNYGKEGHTTANCTE